MGIYDQIGNFERVMITLFWVAMGYIGWMIGHGPGLAAAAVIAIWLSVALTEIRCRLRYLTRGVPSRTLS